MKKILQVTTVSRTINAFLIPHIKEGQKQNNLLEIASNIDLEISNELSNMVFHKISFSRNPLSISNLKAIKEIQNLFDEKKYDVVHVHTPVAAFVTRLALRKRKVEVVYTAHGFHFYKGAPFINWAVYYSLEKIASKWTDKLITINNEDFERANLKLKNERCKVFKINGIGIDLKEYSNEKLDVDFKKSLGLKENDIVITVIAELIKRKNHKQIIDALAEIKDRENIKVLFAGNGALTAELKSYVKEKKLEQNIIFLGFRTDVEKIISITDIIGLFAYQEGLPRNLMEGMAQKKPILCTDIRGNNDLVVDGENGMLVEVENIKETVSKLEKMINSKELRDKMGEKSLEKVKKYKIENVLKEMYEIYNL